MPAAQERLPFDPAPFSSSLPNLRTLSHPGAGQQAWRLITRCHRLLWMVLLLLATGFVAEAQSFQPLPGLAFTKLYAGGNPNPQLLTVASTGNSIRFIGSVAVSSGGNWLSISASGCCGNTPEAELVTVNPDPSLAPGSYNGQITFKSTDGTQTLVVPVSLTVEQPSATFFDTTPGALTFSFVTGKSDPPSQVMGIRNAGSGVLQWTAAASTSDGGGWITLSTHNGTAPSRVEVGIDKNKLPGAGLVPGTYVGQVLLQTAGNAVTVPVTATVGADVFEQLNPLYFNKTYRDTDQPPAQEITLASTGDSLRVVPTAINPNLDKWLTVTPNGCCSNTPASFTVSVTPGSSLAAGTYTAEIIFTTTDGTQASVVPVTLTVAPPAATFFDATAGELSFSLATRGSAPPSQPLQIRNAGRDTLNWTASASTADGGGWLILSATGGTAPSTLQVSVDPTKLPDGQVSGTYVGQVLLQTAGDAVTVPITVNVGVDVFQQLNPLFFTKPFKTTDQPPAQEITVASTGDSLRFIPKVVESTGGSWLSVTPNGCCSNTPASFTVTATPDVSLAAGSYTAEIIFTTTDGTQASVVPVTLTVAPPTATFFDQTAGELTFSLATKGNPPPSQPLEIRNAGVGTLQWTATASTADAGNWLTLSASSGTAPSTLQVSIDPAKLPDGGQVPGTYVGQVTLHTQGDDLTVPITATVATSAIAQINPLYFTKPFKVTDQPAAQEITVASTADSQRFIATAVNSTGGKWLTVTPNGCCSNTPAAFTVSANPDVNLPAGTYTAEIIITTTDGTESDVVPVTLTVASPIDAFFDATPGALTFSMIPGETASSAQDVAIRNAGSGTLNWSATVTTADGGSWLSVSALSGTAPATLHVNVNPAHLPDHGFGGGTYIGQVLLRTGSDAVSIPVIYTLGTSVFEQPSALSFAKPAQGTDPPAQSLVIASTGNSLRLIPTAVNASGGAWLSINPSGCCSNTPQTITVTAKPAASLASGVYFAEIILTTTDDTETSVVPITLTVGKTTPPPTATSTPTISPTSGTYSAAQTVILSDATAGAVIHFTTDGSAPTANSPVYAGPLTIRANETVKAVALASGYTLSSIATATYTFTNPLVKPTSLAFGSQAISTTSSARSVAFTNPGLNTLTGLSASITGPDAADFKVVAGGCSSSVAGDASCMVSVTFTPAASGARSAILNLSYGGLGSPIAIPLSGTGSATNSQITLTPSPSSITYGQPLSVSAMLSGSPAPTGSLSYRIDRSATQTAPLTSGRVTLHLGVLGAGAHTLTVSYDGGGAYGAATQTLNITVAPAVLTVTAANASRPYGSANPAFSYGITGFVNGDTKVVVSGSATLETSATATTAAGTYPLTFATEALTAANYVFSYLPATLTITRASETITFPALPATAVYGHDGPFSLNATASSGLPVTYVVSGPATLSGNRLTLAGAGTVSIKASQPGNADYSAASPVTRTITVSLPASDGTPELVTTAALSRQPDGSYLATVVVFNHGTGTAINAVLGTAAIGNNPASPLPDSLGSIAPGNSVTVHVRFPASVGTSGSRVIGRFTGAYRGGVFGGSLRLTLP